MRPSEEEALELHRKYGSSEFVVRHCRTVARVTWVLMDELKRQGKQVDSEAAVAGALLHDIGRTRTQNVGHGLAGSEILAGEGVEDAVVQIVRRHVGAGISADEARVLGLPDLDYLPRTREEMIVCFADKMVDADEVRSFEIEVRRFAMKGHDVERLVALKKHVEAEMGEDPEALLFDKIKETE